MNNYVDTKERHLVLHREIWSTNYAFNPKAYITSEHMLATSRIICRQRMLLTYIGKAKECKLVTLSSE